MVRVRLYFLCLFLCFQGFGTPALGAGDAEKPETHARFVSRFLDMVKQKFSFGVEVGDEVDQSRRGFMAGSGAAVLTASLGGVGGLARMAGLGGLPEAWLKRLARLRSSSGLSASGLDNYIKILEEELTRVSDPAMQRALKARIAHARQTIANISEVLDPVTGAVRDRMSLPDTRETLNPSNASPDRLRRLKRNLESSRQRVLADSQRESTLIESLLEAEVLLSPILRNRLNVQVRYTRPLLDEYVIALDDEDVAVVEDYLEMLWVIQEWMETYPETGRGKVTYSEWLRTRVEFTDRALRALRASKKHLSCEEMTAE